MKKLICLLAYIICLATVVNAAHMKGGEITWECQANGTYVFYLKLYRDCNGLAFGVTQQINATGGGVSTIPMTFITSNDLTPLGCGNSCINPNGLSYTQESIYRSDTITLTGTPPSTGWAFYWNFECCRNNVDNLINGNGQMVLRSIMYPYPITGSVNPCYDSSPRLHSPVSTVCVASDYEYNPLAFDSDYDSLSYGFDYAYESGTGFGVPIAFQPPYSVNNPVPGNPVMNSSTGEININAQLGTTLGVFSLVTRVDSWRCGTKISSVFRDIQVDFSNVCDPVCGSGGTTTNHPPDIYPAPFVNPGTGLLTDYADTVSVGDTVQFTLSLSEFEYHAPSCWPPQVFWIDAGGGAMDSSSVAPYNNCNRPPCAYLDLPTPAGPYLQGKEITFTWIPDCIHAIDDCDDGLTTYPFFIKAYDDNCAFPATNYLSLSVTVRGLRVITKGDTLIVNAPSLNFQWYLNGTIIPGATSDTLLTGGVGGTYTVQAVSTSGCVMTSNIVTIPVGLNELIHSDRIQLYPNPALSTVIITAHSFTHSTLSLYDLTGRALLQQPFNEQATMDVSTLRQGMYVVEVRDKEGKSVKGKLIKE